MGTGQCAPGSHTVGGPRRNHGRVAGFSWASWGLFPTFEILLGFSHASWVFKPRGASSLDGPSLGEVTGGKGRHRGQYDWVPQGPWRHGYKLQRAGLRTVSGLAEGWAGS